MTALRQMIEDLREAAQIEGTELGEWWHALIGLYPRIVDGGSEEFKKAFEKELVAEHKRLKEEFKIVETTETRIVKFYELVEIDY